MLLLFLLFPGRDVRVSASSSQLYPLRNDRVPKTTLPSVLPGLQSYPSVLIAVLAAQSAVLEQAVHIDVHSSVRPHIDLEPVANMCFQLENNCLARAQLVAGNLIEAGEGLRRAIHYYYKQTS